jgi:hypothetical protein
MEFVIDGKTYRAERLDAKKQFHISRRLAPVLGVAIPALQAIKGENDEQRGLAALAPLADALSGMSDADADYVLFGLLAGAKRQMAGGTGWTAVVVGEQINHMDIGMPQMLQIAWAVARHNFADFMGALSQFSPGATLKQNGQ